MTGRKPLEKELAGSVLTRRGIIALLNSSSPLIQGFIDRDTQIGENGVDLTVRRASKFLSRGTVDFTNQEREISQTQDLDFNRSGWLELDTGAYKVEYNEILNLPKNLIGIALPRSSLIRCGVALITSIWDAGYKGRGKSMLAVLNPKGFRMKKDSRVAQLVLLSMESPSEKGYRGVFQGE